jgi:hypothetical protein
MAHYSPSMNSTWPMWERSSPGGHNRPTFRIGLYLANWGFQSFCSTKQSLYSPWGPREILGGSHASLAWEEQRKTAMNLSSRFEPIALPPPKKIYTHQISWNSFGGLQGREEECQRFRNNFQRIRSCLTSAANTVLEMIAETGSSWLSSSLYC